MRESDALFDLAHLIDAGIAPVEAVGRLLRHESRDSALLSALHAQLKHGSPLARALGACGIASRLETAILETAAGAGKLHEALRLVAANAERRQRRAAGLRWRLWLPNFILIIALVAGAVRAVSGGADAMEAMLRAGFVAIAVIALSQALLNLLRRDASTWLALGWGFGLHATSSLYRAFFEQIFYTLFAWLAAGGVDYVAAAKPLRALLDNTNYRKSIEQYRRTVAAGGSVTEALAGAGLLPNGELRQVIQTGEGAGRLAPALQHYLRVQDARIERVTAQIFAWLPRFYYLIVVVIGGVTLF